MSSYDPASDRLYIRGGSDVAPKTQSDVYDEDKAGTLTNHSRTGITGTDPSPVNVTYPLKPADYVVLGGDAHDLWILISSWSGFTDATIRLIGTDRDGDAQTEDVVVTGNGTYYATKWFKTLTQTQVVGVTGSGSFSYNLEQGQWGVGWKIEKGYKWNCNVVLSYGVGCYFKLTNELMYVTGKFDHYSFGTFHMGELIDERGTNGATLIVDGGADYPLDYYITWKIYGSRIYSPVRTLAFGEFYGLVSGIQFVDAFVQAAGIWLVNAVSAVTKFKRVTLYGLNFYIGGELPLDDVLLTHAPTNGIYWYGTVKNVTCESNVNDFSVSTTLTAKDCSFNRAKISLHVGGGTFVEVYTLNLKITDKNGNPVSSVTVKAYKNGDYTDLTPNVGATPVIDTVTDVNGKIPEQILEVWRTTNLGGGTQDRNPFLWTLEHPDYPTKKFIRTQARRKLSDGDWVYAYAEETTGTHAQILSAIDKHDKKITGLVA